MTEHNAFSQAIIENPADDAVRLVYADWLEEHDEPERAEFIRIQIRLAQTECCPLCTVDKCVCNRHNWWIRERELLDRHIVDWSEISIFNGRGLSFEDIGVFVLPKEYDGRWKLGDNEGGFRFRRGFIAEVTLTCQDWLTHREQLLRTAPLEKVTLTHWMLSFNRPQHFTPRLISLAPLPSSERFIHKPWHLDVRNGGLFTSWGDPVHLFTLEEYRILLGDSTAAQPLGMIHAPARRR